MSTAAAPIKTVVLALLRQAQMLAGGYPSWEQAGLPVEVSVKV